MSTAYTVQSYRGGFALVWKDGGTRHRRQLDANDRASAEAEARILWHQSSSAPWTVERLVNQYIELLAVDAPPSLQRRRDAWKAMRHFWANVDPARIDAAMCRSYAQQRQAGNATIRYELLMLSTALNAVKGNGVTAKPPMWLPPKPERKVRHLSRTEFETFFASVKAPHAKLYVLLGLYTMARPSAILDLTWDRVDFVRGLIDFNPPGRRQTAKRRPTIRMNQALRDALKAAYDARQFTHVIEHGGKPLASIKKAFQSASERCGITVTAYMLRHTGAVWAAEAGVAMAELAQYMGHDDDRTTQTHYARFSPDFLVKVADAVQRQPKQE